MSSWARIIGKGIATLIKVPGSLENLYNFYITFTKVQTQSDDTFSWGQFFLKNKENDADVVGYQGWQIKLSYSLKRNVYSSK